MIHIVLQELNQDCPVYEVFQREFIGEKLAGEIQLQIDSGEKGKENPKCSHHFESNFSGWLKTFTALKTCRDEMRYQKENNNDLVQFDEKIKKLFQEVNLEINEKSKLFVSKVFWYQLHCAKVCCFTSQENERALEIAKGLFKGNN